MADGIGLSVGANSLRAVLVGRAAVTRTPVLTRFPHRPPEVGLPSENPKLTERGLIVTDFVDRVGDPVAIVAGDGSSHRAEVLLADALRALSYTLTGGRPAADPIGVSYPAHWRPACVEALRGALAAVPEFAGAHPVLLTSDALAAMTALQQDPGVPTRGIIALCDLGGTGTSITLVDAGNGFAPIAPTVRYSELSGDLIDQALLTRVVGDLAEAGSMDVSSTSAIGSLGRLRGQCRAAKERLSTSAVTSLAVELPGRRTEVRLTRTELDDAIRDPLAGLVGELQDALQRSNVRPTDLVAVASVGGGARIPIITTALSEHLRVPVITSGQPELAAAIGGGTKAVRGLVPDNATAMAPAAALGTGYVVPAAGGPEGGETMAAASLAWSEADVPEVSPHSPMEDEPADEWDANPRPLLAFADRDPDDEVAAAPPWYRSPFAMLAAGLIVVVAAIGLAAYVVLRGNETPEAPVYSNTPVTSAPSSPAAPPVTEAPPSESAPQQQTQAPPRTVTQQAPPPTVTRTQEPPASEAPPPSTEAPPTTEAPPPTSEAPPVSEAPTTQPPFIPTIPPIPTIPGLPPFIPQLGGG